MKVLVVWWYMNISVGMYEFTDESEWDKKYEYNGCEIM